MATPGNQRVILLQPDSAGNYHEMLVDSSGKPLSPTTTNLTVLERLRDQDFLSYLAAQGKTFTAGPATAVNNTETGQTSFASTTPTFLLDVPSGITAIPLFMGLCQTGTVAGGDIDVIMGKDKIKRYSSGGTASGVVCDRSGANVNPSCTLYRSPTAIAGVAIRMMGLTLAADVSPAEGVINEIVWTPAGALDFLDGPATWAVWTYAGTTGPTWFYEFKWAEVATSDLALA